MASNDFAGVREQIIANAVVIYENKFSTNPEAEDFNVVLKTVRSRNGVHNAPESITGYQALLMKTGAHSIKSQVLMCGEVFHCADKGPDRAFNALANLLDDTCDMASRILGG